MTSHHSTHRIISHNSLDCAVAASAVCSEALAVLEHSRLLSRIHESRGSILVYARVRPPTSEELAVRDAVEVVDILSDTELAFFDGSKR
jgi:hypothetical protein